MYPAVPASSLNPYFASSRVPPRRIKKENSYPPQQQEHQQPAAGSKPFDPLSLKSRNNSRSGGGGDSSGNKSSKRSNSNSNNFSKDECDYMSRRVGPSPLHYLQSNMEKTSVGGERGGGGGAGAGGVREDGDVGLVSLCGGSIVWGEYSVCVVFYNSCSSRMLLWR